MRKISRIAAVFAAAAFLITALLPAAGIAVDDAKYNIKATVSDGAVVDPAATSGYTQVAVGTPVTLTAPELLSNSDSPDPVDPENTQRSPRADTAPTYKWSVEPISGSGMPDTTSQESINVTPTEPGTFTYTVEIFPNSATTERADSTITATFELTVVNTVKNPIPVSADAGSDATMKVPWGAGTNTAMPSDMPSDGMTFQWAPTTTADDVPGLPATASTRETKIHIDGTISNGTTFKYTATPVYKTYKYSPIEFVVTVSNTFAAEQNPTVQWYQGDNTQPSLTAKFTNTLESSAWQSGSSWTEDGTILPADSNRGVNFSTFTVTDAIASTWTAGKDYAYCCKATSMSGSVAVGQVTVQVIAPQSPTVTGSAAVNQETYGTAGNPYTLDAVAAGPPTLSVEATGGKGGVLGSGSSGSSSSGSSDSSGSGSAQTNPYTYTWYSTGSSYSTDANATKLTETSSALKLTGTDLAQTAGDTAYFVCEVGIKGNSAAASVATQKFAVRTIASANLQPSPQSSSTSSTQPVDVELKEPLTLEVSWNPPVPPTGVQYNWTVTEAPAGGLITLKTARNTATYAQGNTTEGERSIQVLKFSAAGKYVVQCAAQTPGTAARTLSSAMTVTFEMTAGAPSVPKDIRYATQDTTGGIVLQPTTLVGANGSVSVDVNSRLALYIDAGTNSDTEYAKEWLVRRSPSENPETLPSGAGFYGVNGDTLVTGPVTAQMNGWQFCMKISSASAPSLNATSSWVTMHVNGAAASTTPQVTLTSTPAAQNGSVSAAAGANVMFAATVTNANSIPAANLSYQWYTQAPGSGAISQAIEGATSPTYTVSSVTAALNGQSYWCVVSNSGHMNEQGTSPRLSLNVNSTPGAVIITDPTGPSLTNLASGKPVTFIAQASTTDGSGLTYQWYMRKASSQIPTGSAVTTIAQAQQYLGAAPSSAVPNGSTATLTVASIDPGVYEYSCLVSNAANSSLSQYTAPYYVAVTQQSTKPIITEPTHLTYVGGKAGEPLYMLCEAYLPTDGSPTYQWQTATSIVSGNWSDLGGYTSADLRIPSLSDQNNGAYYRCMVKNPATNEEVPSNAFQVSVWNPNDTPVVTGNPQSTSYTINPNGTSTPADFTGYLESTATSGNTAGLVARWQYRASDGQWVNVPSAAYPGISGVTTSNGTSRLTLEANAALQAPSGAYQCVWMAGTQANDQPLIPQATSMMAVVDIILPGNPRITTQPVGAAVHVGSTAAFSVGADLSQQGTLVYVWQTSADGGKTWRNCTSTTDGTGQFTASFQTYPVTEQMYETLAAASPGNLENSIYQYRCIVANRAKSRDEVSAAVPLTILPGSGSTPTIAPGSGSKIQIVGSGGAKYTKGLDLTASGTTAADFLKELGYSVPAGYTLALLNKDGQEVPSSAIVCTGMRLVLIQTVSEETVDTVNIVVMGDVLGEGKIGLTQLVAMARAFRGRENLSGAYYQAALLTGKDRIQLSDLVAEAALYKQLSSAPAASSSPSAEPTASASPSAGASAESSASASASASGAR